MALGCLVLVSAVCVFSHRYFHFPFRPPPSTSSHAHCINGLRHISYAKEQWRSDFKKSSTDTPTWDDLIGTNLYIRQMPVCPSNGTYTIGSLLERPQCTIFGHTLQ